jgi:hypothetical protein
MTCQKFEYFCRPDFLGEIFENVNTFMIAENDANKLHKKISVEVSSLVGS